jgi:hypothetical protein
MSDERCPHCGSDLPGVRDAFCGICREPLDEPPEVPRTPEEQAAFRASREQVTKEELHILARIWKFFNWF